MIKKQLNGSIATGRRFFALFFILFSLVQAGFIQADVVGQTTSQTFHLTFAIPYDDERGIESLGVELDGYDINALSVLDGESLSVQLPSPLDTGSHQLSVLILFANGDMETLVEQEWLVESNGGLHNNWIHNVSLNGTYRSIGHEKTDFKGVEHWNSNGAVFVRGETSKEAWTLKTEADVMYDNNRSNNASGQEFDMAHYQIEASYQGETNNAYVRMGDDGIEQESLLFSGYQRRGLSGGVSNKDQSMSMKVFAYHSDPTTDFDNNLASPNHREERSTGGTLSYSPLANTDALRISTTYIEGEGTSAGAGFEVLDDDTIYGGSTWNLALDSRLLEGALWLHGEFAQSSFDSDGIGVGEGHQSDDAWSASAEYSVFMDQTRWLFDQWTTGYKIQEIGAKYWSIGNLGLPGDLYSQKIYYQGNRDGFGLTAEWIQEKNNVANDVTIADQTADFYNTDFYYTPMSVNTENSLWKTLGIPSYNGYAHMTRRKQDNSDGLLAGYNLDNVTSEYSLGVNFSKETFSWGLQHSQIYWDDRSDILMENGFTIYEPLSDSVNYLTTLQFSFMPSARISFSPMLQWNVLEETDTNNQYDSLNLGFDSQFQIIPEKWLFSLNYSFNQNDSIYEDNLGVDSRLRDQTLNLQSTWKLFLAKGISPGMDLYLKGSYNRQQEMKVKQGEEIYQILVGFTLYWNNEG